MIAIVSYLKSISLKVRRKAVLYIFNKVKNYKLPFKSGRLLLVRLDGIGDYVLFRNFIQELKQVNEWKDYKISLLGNKIFKELAESLDSHWIEEFIWIDPKSLRGYHFFASLSLRLKLKSYDVLINPMHSRIAFHDEFLSYFGSKVMIGSEGDNTLFKDQNTKLSCDRFYNHLVPSLSVYHFEFFRNRYFFDRLLNKSNNVRLSITTKKSRYLNESSYNIIIFPGAGFAYRQWSPEKFTRLIQLLSEAESDKKLHFYIAGGRTDKTISERILTSSNLNIITDLTGNTSLLELGDLIGSANLLISNETSAVHIAVATQTPVVCISNGNHYGRFNPYPNKISDKIITIYPYNSFYTSDEVEREKLIERYKYRSDLDINLIDPSKVFEAARKLMTGL